MVLFRETGAISTFPALPCLVRKLLFQLRFGVEELWTNDPLVQTWGGILLSCF